MGKLKQQSVELQKKSLTAVAKQHEAEKALEKEQEILKGKQAELAKTQSSAPALAPSAADSEPTDKGKPAATQATKAALAAPSPVPADGSTARMPKVPVGGFKFAPSSLGKISAESSSKSASQPAARAASPTPTMAKQITSKSTASAAAAAVSSDAPRDQGSSKKGTDGKFAASAAAAAAAAELREKIIRRKKKVEELTEASNNAEGDKAPSAPPKKRVARTSESDKPADAKLAGSTAEVTTAAAAKTIEKTDEDAAVKDSTVESEKKESGNESIDESKVDVASSEAAPSSGFGFGKSSGGGSSVFGGGKSPTFGSGSGFVAPPTATAAMFGSSSTVSQKRTVSSGFGAVAAATSGGGSAAGFGGGKQTEAKDKRSWTSSLPVLLRLGSLSLEAPHPLHFQCPNHLPLSLPLLQALVRLVRHLVVQKPVLLDRRLLHQVAPLFSVHRLLPCVPPPTLKRVPSLRQWKLVRRRKNMMMMMQEKVTRLRTAKSKSKALGRANVCSVVSVVCTGFYTAATS